MISAQQFREKWQDRDSDRLVAFPADSVADFRIPEDAKAFLIEAGLPADAAPFLSFGPPKKGALPRASDTLWHLTPDFSRYLVIGSNRSDDPVCIDEAAEGQIVYLDHENYFERVLIASSVFTLAECLLAFRAFLGDSTPPNSERIGVLIGCLHRIDPAACEQNGFWPQQCRGLAS